MLWVTVYMSLVYWNTISSQPLDDQVVRVARSRECCPCPTPRDVPNCPCGPEDTETAPSIFTPAFRAMQDYAKPLGPKEDLKPLLEPEVGLASSVLRTLQEVTDAEYEDALARDAARSAARAAEPDLSSNLEYPGNIVNVILSPRENVMFDTAPEASHYQETRCVHPHDITKEQREPLNLLRRASLLKKPKGLLQRSLFDMDNGVGASTIQERLSLPKNIVGFNNLNQKPEELFPTKNKLGSNNFRYTDLSVLPSEIEELKSNKKTNDVPHNLLQSLHSRKLLSSPRPLDIKRLLKLKDVEFVPLKENINDGKKIFFSVDNVPAKVQSRDVHDDCEDKKETQPDTKEFINEANDLDEDDPLHSATNVLYNPQSPVSNYGTDNSNNADYDNHSSSQAICLSSPSSITDSDGDIPDNELDGTNKIINSENSDNFNFINASGNEEIYSQSKAEDKLSHNFNDDCNNNVVNHELKFNSTDVDVQSYLTGSTDIEVPEIPNDIDGISSTDNLSVDKSHNTAFPNMKADLLKTLENLKNTHDKIYEKLKLSKVGDTKDNTREESGQITQNDKESKLDDLDCQNEATNMVSIPEKNIDEDDTTRDDDPISIQELQEMSDTILNLSTLNEKALESFESKESNSFPANPECINVNENLTDIENPSLIIENDEGLEFITDDSNVDSSPFQGRKGDSALNENSKLFLDTEIPVNTYISDEAGRVVDSKDECIETNTNEMTAEASDPSVNAVPANLGSSLKSSLLDNIVQPKFLDNALNIFQKPVDISDIFNLNRELPTFDNLNPLFPKILTSNARNAENRINEENTDSFNESSNKNSVMSTLPKNSGLKLPSIENINYDIFPFKPTVGAKTGLRQPTININSYKSKLPIPKSLDITPMNLKSARNIDSTPKIPTIKTTSANKPSSFRRSKQENNADLLQNPFKNLPRLDDLGSLLTNNGQNLLSTPKLFGRADHGINTFSDNLRSRTENSFRNMQQSLSATSPGRRLNYNKLGNNLFNSDDVAQRLSSTRDDVNEKLKALHMDFNDRIESFHRNIMDQSLFNTNKELTAPGLLRFPQLRSLDRKGNSQTPIPRLDKPKSSLQTTSRRSKANKEADKLPYKITALASAPRPRTIQLSKYDSVQSQPSVLQSSPRSNILQQHKIIPDKTPSSISKLSKPKDTKIEISFPTSKYPTSISKEKPKPLLKAVTKPVSSEFTKSSFPSNIMSKKLLSQSSKQKVHDPKVSASEMKYSTFPLDDENSESKTVDKIKNTDTQTSVVKINAKETPARPRVSNLGLSKPPKSLSGHTGNTFLSKVRETVKTSLSPILDVETEKNERLKTINSSPGDIIQSVSENIEFLSTQEALKENIPYKCRMLCVKDV